MFNYHNKKFKVVSNSSNGEVEDSMVFHYQQENNILTSSYSGGQIQKGHLIAIVNPDGSLNMRYHQVNTKGELLTGKCQSTPQLTASGKIRLLETWEWTSGDFSSGNSILEEV